MKLLDRQMTYHKAKGTPENDLAALQLASVHAMQANDLLKDSSVVQISIEAENRYLPLWPMFWTIRGRLPRRFLTIRRPGRFLKLK